MVMGDFNVVSSQDEKVGGLPVNLNNVAYFNNMIAHALLTDGGYLGSKFTWSNNRLGNKRILQRLDRVLLSAEWMTEFQISVTHLNRHCSDHAPLLLNVSDTNFKGSTFIFLNV